MSAPGFWLVDIVARKRRGIDCTADESPIVTRWFMRWMGADGELPDTPEADEMARLFSCEWSEVGEYLKAGDIHYCGNYPGWRFS